MKIIQTQSKLFITLLLSAVFFVSSVAFVSSFVVVTSPTTTHASGTCTSGMDGTPQGTQCVNSNCNAANGFGMSPARCLELTRSCASTDWIGITFTGGDTNEASCSNAVLSCLEHAVSQDACGDKNVLARVTGCSDGNVNADSVDEMCGIDNAIEANNIDVFTSTEYGSNRGLKEDYINQQLEACKNLNDTNQIRICEDQVRKNANDCYTEAGGTATRVTPDKLNSCMQKKAQSKEQCNIAGGGKWDEATKKCTSPPPSQNQNDKCRDGSTPDPKTGKCADGSDPGDAAAPNGNVGKVNDRCGQARVNIIICGGDDNTPGATVLTNVLRIALLVLSVLIGIAATGGLAWAAVTYARAADNASTVSQAKDLIRNIVIGLLLYGFLVAIVNWLVPGSVFGGSWF